MHPRRDRRRQRTAAAVTAVAAALGVLAPTPSAAQLGPAKPLTVNVSGANGEGRIETPGRTCDEGGQGAYWNYDYGASLAGGVFSSLPGDVRLHLALHSDVIRFPNTGPVVPMTANAAYLQGTESHASLANDRGTLKVRLSSGNCDVPTLGFNGITAQGGGTWQVDSGQGAYGQATGSGTFTVQADVAPGADNPFNLQLNGSIRVLQPTLKVDVVKTFWGSLGTDYLSRRVSVTYRITNTGGGEAYNARVVTILPNTAGVTVANGGANVRLGDLSPNDSEFVTVRYQLGLLQPCQLIILNCKFASTTKVEWSDALDVVSTPTAVNGGITAPNLPPPL